MRFIEAHNVNQALAEGLRHLAMYGVEQPSRNGPVLVSPWPVVTTYLKPNKRVLFNPTRDANPYFHFMESLWMLAGRNDVRWVAQFNQGMHKYSDDGATLHGAYGYRWREHFKVNRAHGMDNYGFGHSLDQLGLIAEALCEDPTSRRAVLAMWDPVAEWSQLAGTDGTAKDLPCNTHAYFDLLDGRLNMTVCNRSNDIWWGAYGANAVHFSILQEYMAAAVHAPIGVYRQFSNNYHLYPANLPVQGKAALTALADDVQQGDPYTMGADASWWRRVDADRQGPYTVPLVKGTVEEFDKCLEDFFRDEAISYDEPFFVEVAVPMRASWVAFKNKQYAVAELEASVISDDGWRRACLEWLGRRRATREAKA